MVSINTNDTLTCVVGETIRQKVKKSSVCVCVGGGGGGASITRNGPAKMFST